MMTKIFVAALIVVFVFLGPAAADDGPTETRGISAKITGSIPMDGLFADSKGWVMRAREVTIAPGGRIAVHTHDARPAVAYLLEGEVTEHRLSEDRKVVATAGTTMLETVGLRHWIENTGDGPARAIVVDLVPPK